MVGKSLTEPVDLMAENAPQPVMLDVDPDAAKEQGEGLKGSPSALLRQENERRATLDKQIEKRMSNFEERRASRLSGTAPAPGRTSKGTHVSKDKGVKDKAKGEKAVEPSAEASATAVLSAAASAAKLSVSLRPSQSNVRPQRGSRMGSILGGRRVSGGPDSALKGPRYANTYRMKSKNPFKSWQVYKILRETLAYETGFKKTYDPIAAAKRSMDLARDIRLAVRGLNYDRYKFCVKVDVGQKWDQGACSMARFMWDVEKDDFAYCSCENAHFFIIATVFAFYFD